MSPVLIRPRPATSPVALGQMAVVAVGAILLLVLGGELAVTRAQLEADGWRITVPAHVGERLRLAGLRPSAP